MTTNPTVFRDYGGLVQLRLSSPEDLEHVHTLEPARWSATSVPVDQILCDERFLELVDTDNNGRIRVHELIAAHVWLKMRHNNLHRLVERTDVVHLADINTGVSHGVTLRALAEQRLAGPTSAAGSLTLAEIRAYRSSYVKKFPNGDGVITVAQVADPEIKALIEQIIEQGGGADDLSGEKGVDVVKLDAFIQHGRDILAWAEEAKTDSGLSPLGDKTQRASELVEKLGPKIEQFFAQSDLVRHEKAAIERLTETKETLATLDVKDTAAIEQHLLVASLAHPSQDGALDLRGWINPLFADAVVELADSVLPEVLGKPRVNVLGKAEWAKVVAKLESWRAWQRRKPAALPGDLAGEALTALLDGKTLHALRDVVTEDSRASDELRGIGDLEKLALYQRWLLDLANNMVSFPALFTVGDRCLFEVGTLILDGRDMSFCVRVIDRASHKPIAEHSNIFVCYVELERKEGDKVEKMEIAVGITSGTRRGVAVGKRGIFYDRDRREWDAKVTDIIARPISLWEAAIEPFVRLKAFVGDKIGKLMGGRLEALEKQTSAATAAKVSGAATARPIPAGNAPAPAVAPAASPVAPARPAPATPPPRGGLQGVLVGGGIAFAAIGSAAAFALQTISQINPVDLILAIAGVVLAIMLVSAFLGWLKLRRRDVSTLLEACGWAFNVRIYLRRNLSYRYTRVPKLPDDSVRQRVKVPRVHADAENKAHWVWPVVIGLAAAAALWFLRDEINAFWQNLMQ